MTSESAAATRPAEVSRVAPLAACALILAALVDSQVVAAVTPQIAAGLGAPATAVATSVTFYSIAAACVALWLGLRARRLRAAAWLPTAAALFAAASLAASTSPNLVVFVGARAVAGFAGGLISALAISAIADASSYARRGSAMSGVAVAYFLAPVLGVPLGTFVAGSFGWRAVFLLSALLAVLAGFLVRQFPLPHAPARDAAPSDGVEADAAAAGPAEMAPGLGARLRALVRLGLRDRSTRFGIVGAFFVSGGLVGFTTYLATWLSEAFGAGTREIGLVYALAGVGAVAGGALGGKLADRFGKRSVATRASVAMAFMLLALPTFAWSVTLFALVAATAFAAAVRVAPLQALVTEIVTGDERPTYVALRNGASQLGIASSVAACGALYARLGLVGVGAACAAMTALAWLSTRLLVDPGVAPPSPEDRPTPRRRVVRVAGGAAIALAVVVLVVLPWALSLLVTKARTRPGEVAPATTPATFGAQFEDVTFASADGVRLSGWYLAPPEGGRGVTVVMTHGLFRSRWELLERGAALWKHGYGVLLYDLRRHGLSGGEFSTIGYDERFDVEGAARFVRERDPSTRVALFGVSMGAAATLMAASEVNPVAVVAESSFLSLRDTVSHHLELARIPTFPFSPILVGLTSWRMGFLPGSYDVREAVAGLSCPILFVGGSKDQRMPTATVLDPLYAAATNPASRRVVVEGATHGHSFDEPSGDASKAAYLATLFDFLDANTTRAPA